MADTRRQNTSPFVRDALKLVGPAAPGDMALDIPCGSGRHTRQLVDLGYHVIGVDIDGACLETARLHSVDQANAVEWRQLDARAELPFATKTFAVIVVVDYVDLDLLPRLIALLRSGGYLIFQTFNDRGGNWVTLPGTGRVAQVVTGARKLRYRERPAGPTDVDRVTVRGLWQRDGMSPGVAEIRSN